jgi:hypothetical protein
MAFHDRPVGAKACRGKGLGFRGFTGAGEVKGLGFRAPPHLLREVGVVQRAQQPLVARRLVGLPRGVPQRAQGRQLAADGHAGGGGLLQRRPRELPARGLERGEAAGDRLQHHAVQAGRAAGGAADVNSRWQQLAVSNGLESAR